MLRRLLVVAIFVGLPILEIYVIIQVGQVIGALPTIALLIGESILGAWLIKHEGRRAWNALQETLSTGQLPHKELADAALVVMGGTLLLTPGFVTDIFGFFFILPITRPIARKLLLAFAARKILVGTPAIFRPPPDDRRDGSGASPPPGGSGQPDHDGVYDIYHEDDR